MKLHLGFASSFRPGMRYALCCPADDLPDALQFFRSLTDPRTAWSSRTPRKHSMWLIKASLKNPYMVAALVFMIAVLGVLAITEIPKDILPVFKAPAVQ